MQAVADINHLFHDIVIGWPGSVHDAIVFHTFFYTGLSLPLWNYVILLFFFLQWDTSAQSIFPSTPSSAS